MTDFQHLLLQLQLVAGPVKAQNYSGPQVTESKPGSKDLKLTDHEADPFWWAKRWGRSSDTRKAMICAELEGYIQSLKLSKRYDGLERGTAPWRRMIAQEASESSYETVQHRYGVSSKTIAKCVAEFPRE